MTEGGEPAATSAEKPQALVERLAQRMRELRTGEGVSFTYQRDVKRYRVFRLDYESGSMGSTLVQVSLQTPAIPAIDHLVEEAESWPESAPVDAVVNPRFPAGMFRFWLRAVAAALAMIVESGDDPAKIEDVARILANDMDRGPVPWHLELWLYGLRLDVEEIDLGDGITLRRPIARDFEEGPIAQDPYFESYASMPDAVMTATLESREGQYDIYRQVEVLLDSIRLFRACSLGVSVSSAEPQSFVTFPGSPYRFRIDLVMPATVSADDATRLPAFVSLAQPLLRNLQVAPPAKPPAAAIALRRYRESLGEEFLDAGIAAAITSLEALFLKGSERQELTYKLTRRVASLLRHFGDDPLDTAAQLTTAYDVRSKYVHGAHARGDPATLEALRNRTVDVAREALTAMVQLEASRGLPKEQLIDKLDDQMLSPGVGDELGKLCDGLLVPS